MRSGQCRIIGLLSDGLQIYEAEMPENDIASSIKCSIVNTLMALTFDALMLGNDANVTAQI
jgi:hypothetical protein